MNILSVGAQGTSRRRPGVAPSGYGVAAALVALALLGVTTWASAAFMSATSADHSLASATLDPATSPMATTSCGPLLSFSAQATVSWTATPSTFATGHKVERWLGSSLQTTTTVTPRTTVSVVHTGLATGTTYTWKIYAYHQAWTSTLVSVSATTPGVCL